MKIIPSMIFVTLLVAVCAQAQQPKSATPRLHNECLGKPVTTGQSEGHGQVSITNICSNSISSRFCVKYSRNGWSCQLFPGILPHSSMKSFWSSNNTGEVVDVRAWAMDYAAGEHANDYKNLPTVEEPSKVVISR
jgi:hypothetical protein